LPALLNNSCCNPSVDPS